MAWLRRMTLCAALQLSCAAGSSTKSAEVSEVSLERAPLPAAEVPTPAEPAVEVPSPNVPSPDVEEQPPPIKSYGEAPSPPWDPADADPTDPWDHAHSAVGRPVAGAVVTAMPPSAPVATATKPRPRSKVQCDFPADRKDGVSEGRVVLRVTVDATGKPIDVKIVSESGGFGQTARQCLLTAQFHPGTDAAGAPEVSSTTMVVRFAQP